MSLKLKKIILVSNITDLSGPTEGLAAFLQKKCFKLFTIYHPFFYCQTKKSVIRIFVKGKIIKQILSRNWNLPEFPKYFVDFLLTNHYILKFWQKFDLYIGVNCLHALIGILYRKFGLVKQVIFYTIDWMPHRFHNPFFNWLYFKVDKIARTKVDYVWNLSEKITKIRKKQGVPNNKNLFVPNGVEAEGIHQVSKKNIKRNALVLIGALEQNKGVDLILEAIPFLLRKCPQISLTVIGSTPKIPGIKPYKKLFRKLGKRVTVLGAITHKEVLRLLPHFGIALAPYHTRKDNLSYFAWPARVIDYLACGLPTIITSVPAIAQQIKKKQAGILINYSVKELIQAVEKLLTNNKFYWQARQNARSLVRNLSWNKIFTRTFIQMEKMDEKFQLNKQRNIFNELGKNIKTYHLENYHLSYKKRVFAELKIPGRGKYLDIGCGSLGYLVTEASQLGQKSVGLDCSHKILFQAKNFARKKLSKNNFYKFVYGQAENLPFLDNSFSKISAIAVFEHIYNDEKAIQEIARVLKPEGRIFITVPNDYTKYWLPYRWYYKFIDKKLGHLRHYNLQDLRALFEKYRFRLIAYRYIGHLPKIIQYFLTLIFPPFTNSKWWWKFEKMDLKMKTISSGLHFDLVMEKQK